MSRPALAAGMFLSVLPDLDALAFRFGVPNAHPLGPRDLSHSLAFGLLLAFSAFACGKKFARGPGRTDICFLLLAACSQGLLDAMTDGGKGLALLAPFSTSGASSPGVRFPSLRWASDRSCRAGGAVVLLAEALLACVLLGPALLLRLALTASMRRPGASVLDTAADLRD